MSKISQIDPNFKIPEYVQKEDLCYYDVQNAPFEVHGVFYEEGKYRRIPKALAESLGVGIEYLHTNTSGGRVRFVTDSLYVAIHAELDKVEPMAHIPVTGLAGFDLYADGEYYGTFVPPVDVKDSYDHILEFSQKKLREITLHMPLYCDVKSLLIGLQNVAQVAKAVPYEGKVVYYGHSITQGGCASRPGNSYPNILSRRLNIDHINLGFSGNCKGEPQLAEFVAELEMDAFVMDYDHNAPDIDHLRKSHEPFFRIIREKHPHLPVIFMTSTAQARFFDDQEGRKEVIRKTYENALAAGDQNVYFIDGSKIYHGCDAASVEGCHANDLGFWLQADAVGRVLTQALDG